MLCARIPCSAKHAEIKVETEERSAKCAKVELDCHVAVGQALLQKTVSPLSKPARGVKVWARFT